MDILDVHGTFPSDVDNPVEAVEERQPFELKPREEELEEDEDDTPLHVTCSPKDLHQYILDKRNKNTVQKTEGQTRKFR